MTNWSVVAPIGGATHQDPVVHVAQPRLQLQAIHFATPHSGDKFHYLYLNGNTHPIAPGNLQWWAKGGKIVDPEWVAGRPNDRNMRACFTRNQPVAMRVRLLCSTPAPVNGKLIAEPMLDGNDTYLTRTEVAYAYPGGASELWLVVRLNGKMPDEIGRYHFKIHWSAEGDTPMRPVTTVHYIYATYGQPLEPDHDSPADADPGVLVPRDAGTRSGTAKRLDKLTSLIDRGTRRHRTALPDDVVDLLWKLHVGINNTPGEPPYFDAGHTEFITNNGMDTGTEIPLEDQWLAWIPTASPHWNDASCIGHVQLLKTMAASVGLFARRTWVFPTTSRLPNGNTPILVDTSLYCLGRYDDARQQSWLFTHNGRTYRATPKLMEPGQGWENFEACLRSPSGKFLPGGYTTSSCPQSFRANHGFNSARELIQWWSSTSRPNFGRRFMCWVYDNQATGESHCWDVEGTHYDLANYVQIRNRGKQLPPP